MNGGSRLGLAIAGLAIAGCAIALTFACAHPERSAPAPDAAGPTAGACARTVAALNATVENTKRGLPEPVWERWAQVVDDERSAILASGLMGLNRDACSLYDKQAQAAASALRGVEQGGPSVDAGAPLTGFTEAMTAFLAHCTASDCVPVTMLIGAHTMHQPRLDQTLPKLADELSKVHLAEPTLQVELTRFIAITRTEASALAKTMGTEASLPLDRALRAVEDLDNARDALRVFCGGKAGARSRPK